MPPPLIATWITLMVLSLPQTASATPTLNPGLWHIETTSKIAGRDTPPASNAETRCLDAKALASSMQPGREEHCTISGYQESAHSAQWQVSCNGTHKVSGSGVVHFLSSEAYRSSSSLRIEQANGTPIAVSTSLTAQRIGDCEPEPRN